MRLDNRSTTVHVSGEALGTDAGQSSVKGWYEATGGNVERAEDGGLLVTWSTREKAESVSAATDKGIGVGASRYREILSAL